MVVQRIEVDQNQHSLHLVLLDTYQISLAGYALLPEACDNCAYFHALAQPQHGSGEKHVRVVYVRDGTYASCTIRQR